MKRKRENREKRYKYENRDWQYLDVVIIPLFDTKKKPRADPAQESTVIQKNLNDKNSKRLFARKALHNFGPGDYMLTLNYNDRYIPETMEAAEQELRNYFRRVKFHMKKQEFGDLRYLAVTEATERKRGKRAGGFHIHHHILIGGELGRDFLEDLWRRPRGKGDKEGDRLGIPDSKQLIFNEDGINGLMVYFFGEEKQAAQKEVGIERQKYKRRWTGSKNLPDPRPTRPNDTDWSDKKVEQVAEAQLRDEQPDQAFWERRYPGYKLTKCEPEYNDVTGRWSLYVRMHRRI